MRNFYQRMVNIYDIYPIHNIVIEQGNYNSSKFIKEVESKINNVQKLRYNYNRKSYEELVEYDDRLTSEVNRESIPALSLAQDTSTLTACINDYGPDEVFKRVFSALSSEGDILLVITTSGNSKNIIETLKLAKERGIYSLGFLGNGGGKALSYCDSAFIVPSNITARIQESHITAGHALLQYVEDSLIEIGWLHKD